MNDGLSPAERIAAEQANEVRRSLSTLHRHTWAGRARALNSLLPQSIDAGSRRRKTKPGSAVRVAHDLG